MDDTSKVVVEHVMASQRVYHLSESFGCEVEGFMATEATLERLKKEMSEELLALLHQGDQASELREYAEYLTAHEHTCQIGSALSDLIGCDIDHSEDTIVVNINLARTNWDTVHRHIIALVNEHFSWETIEVEVA